MLDVLTGFKSILSTLPEKEKIVITRRIGLEGEQETLQSIWDDFWITRERVRQIENAWIQKIWRILNWHELQTIQEKAKEILDINWGLLVKDELLSLIIRDNNLDKDFNASVLEIILQSDFDLKKSKPKLKEKVYFYLPTINPKVVARTLESVMLFLKKRKDIIEIKKICAIIVDELKEEYTSINIAFVNSVMNISLEIVRWEEKYIWLKKWKILNPTTLKDKSIYIFRKNKKPFHFIELTNEIVDYFKESVKVATVHNELIRNNDFVLIWRWIYVLKEWGYKAWTVLDMIIDVLSKSEEPMSSDDIINRVLKVRKVKPTTIYMNLQNKKYIKRVWRNLYDWI